jgi:hypothetical protein
LIKDITGQRFGKIVVLSIEKKDPRQGVFWLCACDCGQKTVAKGTAIRYGSVKSCGCGSREAAIRNFKDLIEKHRVPYPHSRKLKDLRTNMLARCYDPSNNRWKNYGGRGIKVCEEWLNNSRRFYDWVMANGYEPGLTLDRIDVDGNYEPSNCRFVGMIVQMNNTTRNRWLEWNGKSQTVSNWARELGVTRCAIQHRVDRRWSIEQIFTRPYRKSRAC